MRQRERRSREVKGRSIKYAIERERVRGREGERECGNGGVGICECKN